MKRKCLILAIIGLILVCVGKSSASTNLVSSDLPLPRTLFLSWGGIEGITSVEWDGKSLVYKAHVYGRTNEATITPSKEAWTNFWKAMDQVRVWEWQGRYINSNVVDGLAWNVEIETGTKKVHAFGKNGYPKDGSPGKSSDSPSPSKFFMAYQRAVEALIGRKL